jgi:hypothetical protein
MKSKTHNNLLFNNKEAAVCIKSFFFLYQKPVAVKEGCTESQIKRILASHYYS